MDNLPMLPDQDGNGYARTPGLPQQARNDQASSRMLEGDTPFLTSQIQGLSGYDRGQIWLGANPLDRASVGIVDNRHLITIAGNRGGKGESAVIPNLLDYPGSIICLDPKGENATVTANRRNGGSEYCEGMRQKVCVLDPYGIADVPDHLRASFNPLEYIDRDSLDAVDQAKTIAEGLVVMSSSNDKTWDEAAKQFLSALVLYVKVCEPPERQNLLRVRTLLMEGDVLRLKEAAEAEGEIYSPSDYDAFEWLFREMMECDLFRGFIANNGAAMRGIAPETRSSVLFHARINTAFIDSLRMEKCLSSSTFHLDELKNLQSGMTIYLCLPVGEFAKDSRWFRMMVSLAMERMERMGRKMPACGHPVLFMMDEFATLGRVDVIERMIAFIAGFKVKLWIILQTLEQLKQLYPGSWETFIDSAGILQCFANTGRNSTLKYLSERLGSTEVRQRTNSYSQGKSEGKNWGDSTSQGDSWGTNEGTGTSTNFGQKGLIFAPESLGHSNSSSKGTQSGSSITRQTSEGFQTGQNWSQSVNETITVAPLLRPEEIERRFASETQNQLVFVAGNLPIVLKRIKYHKSALFRGKFDPDPSYPAPPTLKQLEDERWKKSMEKFKGF